jgi:hypothetical protein
MSHRNWRIWRLTVTIRSLIVLNFVAAFIGCRSRMSYTLDSPSQNLFALPISIASYQTTYNRCLESLSALGPPGQGQPFNFKAAGLISSDLASGRHKDYIYTFHRSGDRKACKFTITADPADPRAGQLHYFTDETAVHRYEVGIEATEASPRYTKDN